MEIERKYLIDATKLPFSPEDYPVHHIEQGYLCTEPVVRIRKDNEDYFLTYKSKGLMSREEYNLPLTKEAYEHLKPKVDGRIISKKRYVIPLSRFITRGTCSDLKIELDIFSEDLQGLVLGEVEFHDEESALSFIPPVWFGEDVTFSSEYHNSNLSQRTVL